MRSKIQIKKIDILQAQALSTLAKHIYIPHYPYLWEPGGVDWYIHEYAYPLHKIEAELADPNNEHFIVYSNNKAVGYLKINIDSKANDFGASAPMELERIYIDINFIQEGLGTQLMQFVIDLAKKHQKHELILKAMDSANKALHFYQKHDFKIVGSFRLPDDIFKLMKPEYRGMLLLKRTI